MSPTVLWCIDANHCAIGRGCLYPLATGIGPERNAIDPPRRINRLVRRGVEGRSAAAHDPLRTEDCFELPHLSGQTVDHHRAIVEQIDAAEDARVFEHK